jgi:hypothetical protein
MAELLDIMKDVFADDESADSKSAKQGEKKD